MKHWMNQPTQPAGKVTWSKSTSKRRPQPSEKAKSINSFRHPPLFSAFREGYKTFYTTPFFLKTVRPLLSKPNTIPIGSFQPPRYFSRGAIEMNRKKNPTPIWYLITESFEQPIPQPVPHNTSLIRSLCKGRGILRKTNQGLTYLDIDNRFIRAMSPYLREKGLIRPPYFNLFSSPEGAHIPLIAKREADFHYLDTVHEIDQEFSFEIEGLYSIRPDTWQEVEELWFFKVHSPQLEALRKRYFLTSLPNGHDFHITIAIRPRDKSTQTPPPPLIMRINPAFVAA